MVLLIAGVAILGIGVVLVSTAHKKYGDDAPGTPLRKVGLGLVFLGTVVLMYVLAINILYYTGRLQLA